MAEEDEAMWLAIFCARHVNFGHDAYKLDTIVFRHGTTWALKNNRILSFLPPF
jgi:hypothetical protein